MLQANQVFLVTPYSETTNQFIYQLLSDILCTVL